MKKSGISSVLKYSFLFFVVLVLFVNLKSLSGVDLSNKEKTKKVVIKQLNYLEHELKHDNLGQRMQKIFPEGFVFINVLYGLSWCELALSYDLDSCVYEKAYQEALYAYEQVNSDQGKSIFSNSLAPEYGAFYAGWRNYLLGKIISFHPVSGKDSLDFKNNCRHISKAFSESHTPYLESYYFASWPADNFLCIASLKIHDQVFEPQYEGLIDDWIAKVKKHVDPFTGLVPHSSQTGTGKTLEGARGCSISLILRLLAEIDLEFAVEQYQLYEEYFLIKRLGVPAISEYPRGKSGSGDIDSGPVIWKVGFAGTIVSIGVFKTFGDLKNANRLSNAMEAYGFSCSFKKRKRYIFGALPIADAFIAWSRLSPVRLEQL